MVTVRLLIGNIARRIMDRAELVALWAERTPLIGESLIDRCRAQWKTEWPS